VESVAAALRQGVSGRPLLPYERFEASPRELSRPPAHYLEHLLAHGWRREGQRLHSIVPPVQWEGHGRSFTFYLHAWDPCANLLALHGAPGAEPGFAAAQAYAMDWLRRFQLPLLAQDEAAAIDALLAAPEDFAWYDMAVGLRIYRLAYMLDVLARRAETPDAELELLHASLMFHHRLLARDRFFRGHSNHGLYQALGQAAAARRFDWMPGVDAFLALARQRLSHVMERQFFDSGVHREHSPGYHHMVLGTVIGAAEAGLLADAALRERVGAGEEALTWMVAPDLRLATFGDTDPRSIVGGPAARSQYRNAVLRWQCSAGAEGEPPPLGARAFPDAGCAFARLRAPDAPEGAAGESYLAQMSAFHSRVHKHADHFTFIWHEQGRRVLTDPGRFGYAGRTDPGSELHDQGFWYADPRRIYVESTRAHNCVEIDGRDQPRRAKPFGAALLQAEMQGGLFVTASAAETFRGIRQWRGLVLSPRRFLLVLDWLHDTGGAEHDCRQWFTFDPAWDAAMQDGQLHAEAGAGERLRAASLLPGATLHAPVRGQQAPRMQGWLSDAANSLVPAASFHVARSGSGPMLFATLFALGEALRPHPGSRANAGFSRARLAWTDAKGEVVLEVGRDAAGRLRVAPVLRYAAGT
jgi:hypothetical protein